MVGNLDGKMAVYTAPERADLSVAPAIGVVQVHSHGTWPTGQSAGRHGVAGDQGCPAAPGFRRRSGRPPGGSGPILTGRFRPPAADSAGLDWVTPARETGLQAVVLPVGLADHPWAGPRPATRRLLDGGQILSR